jgi:hypothetical protein
MNHLRRPGTSRAFARLAFAEGGPEQAALLAGAAAVLRQWARRRAWPVLRPGEADLVAQVRQAQGAVRFDEAFAAGSRYSQREAVAAIRGRRRTGSRRPDPRPGLSRSSPARPALTFCCPEARGIFGRSCHARPPAGPSDDPAVVSAHHDALQDGAERLLPHLGRAVAEIWRGPHRADRDGAVARSS